MSQTFSASSAAGERSRHCVARLALGGAVVDERLQRVLHDRLGQAARGVVGAALAPLRPARHVDPARRDDHRLPVAVRADQPRNGQHPREERRVVAARRAQPRLLLRVRLVRERLAERARAAPGLLAQIGEKARLAARLLRLHRRPAAAPAPVARARKPMIVARGTLHAVVQQPLVHVPDLLDVQRAEGEPPRLGGAAAGHLHLQQLQRVEQVQHRAVVDGQGARRLAAPRA